MPHLDGISSLKIIKTEFLRVKVIIFTSYDQPKLLKEIKVLGAEGYQLKTSTSTTLKKAVLAVAAGQTWFPETVTKRRKRKYRRIILLKNSRFRSGKWK